MKFICSLVLNPLSVAFLQPEGLHGGGWHAELSANESACID